MNKIIKNILNKLKYKKFNSLISLLQYVSKKSIDNGTGFNIMIVRNEKTDLQVFHSIFLNNFTDLNLVGFGYALVVLFENENDYHYLKFKESKFNNIFLKLKDEFGYYYYCGNDLIKTNDIICEFCDEIYDYKSDTKCEFRTEYPNF